MKHQALEELLSISEVHSEPRHEALTRSQRLERWAELLERTPERALGTLAGTEHRVAATRDTMRGAGSPITVAFDDPLLRSEGLKDDTYGGAKRFFQMTDWQLHEIICDCQSGSTMKAARAA